MKTVTLSLFILLLFACNSSFAQAPASGLDSIKDSELVSIQNQVLKQDTSVEKNKEIIISIDNKQNVAKTYRLLENKFRQLSVYKLRTLKA